MHTPSKVPSTLKRQRLRVAVKLMLLTGFLVIVYVSFSSFQSAPVDAPPVPQLSIDVSQIQVGSALTINWNDRPIIVIRRTPAEIQALTTHNPNLKDPQSARSQQPAYAQAPLRSRDPQWFIGIGLGTDFSCPVERVRSVPAELMGVEGRSGLKDTCRGSYYDLAGRVLQGQYADRNLPVPEYRLTGDTLTLGAR